MYEPSLSENAEDALSQLWLATEENGLSGLSAAGITWDDRDAVISQLIEVGLMEQHGGVLSLTDSGKTEAASIIRRERLAERLLTDVLELGEAEVAETACKFEHLLRRGIDDGICTLLGHPRFCPHGSPIPPGECCRLRARAANTVISSLADLALGQSGVVAYLHGSRRELIQRLLSMGVIPGASITLVQTAPSYVFELGEAAGGGREGGGAGSDDLARSSGHGQVAVDRETARDVYVRLTMGKPSRPRRTGWLPGTIRGLRLRRRRGRR